MALMLAPYNEAMRLGMGFNSYTQQLCCNDVVRLPNGRPATEHDLQDNNPKPKPGQSLPESGAQSAIMSKEQGTDMIRQQRLNIGVGHDAQNEVSQVVSWNAKFIDKVSEVTDNLNISGALKVKVDGIGSVEVAGHYIDDKAIKNSDATYDITVKVTNQRLEAPQVNLFKPIDNIPQSRFNEVYGDCFISGFLEGGVFHALVSIKKNDETTALDAGGSIKAEAKVSGLDISGKFEGGIKKGNKKQDYTATVTVNWSGGGDIKPDDVNEWDLKSLTRAAMDFPDKVAACPQRTYAVLTKYSSLRSFHEATVRGSPLDYENAGIYTNSLLDAYMDYKFIWAQIQERIAAVDQGRMVVIRSEEHPSLRSYRQEFKDSYDGRMTKYNELCKALEQARAKKKSSDDGIELEPPMKPNALVPYTADLFGLDEAKRDCRFEMIKIVKEVNAVGVDPKVATDASRIWQYVAPSIFRRLVPTDKPIVDRTSSAAIDGIKAQLQETVRTTAQEYRTESGAPIETFLQSGDPVCELEKRVNLRYGHMVDEWRIDSINGQSVTPATAKSFNDLEVLDKTYVVANITVWYDKERLVGIQLLYQNGQIIFHGVKDASYQVSTFNIDSSRRRDPEKVNLVWLEAHDDEGGKSWVDSIRVVTNSDLFIVEPSDRLRYNKEFKLKASRPRSGDMWDLKGFYGSFDEEKKAFAQLSPVWGRAAVDAPGSNAPPLFDTDSWATVLSWPSSVSDCLRPYLSWGNTYRLSKPIGSLEQTTGQPFNALEHIKPSWVIAKAHFFFLDSSVLSGIAVEYTNGKQLQHGKCGSEMLVRTWEPPTKENERIVAVSTDSKSLGSATYTSSLGFRFFIETEEEVEVKEEAKPEPAPKSDAKADAAPSSTPAETEIGPKSETKVEAPKSDTEEKKTESGATKDKDGKPLPAQKPQEPKKKEKVIKKSDVWITGPMVDRSGEAWSEKNASSSPSRGVDDESSADRWTIKGFMGQAGANGIETVSVIWAKD